MVTALIFASGGRGDTEPVLSVSVALLSAGKFNRIHLCIQPEYAHLVPSDSRITTHLLPFTKKRFFRIVLLEFFKDCFSWLFTGRFDPLIAQNRGLAKVFLYCIVPVFPFLQEVAEKANPDLIASTAITSTAAHALALHHKVPFVALLFQPMHRTQKYPYVFADLPTSIQAARNIAALHTENPRREDATYVCSYEKSEEEFLGLSLPALNSFREELGLPPATLADLGEEGRSPENKSLFLYAYPVDLIPRDPTWPANVHVVNALSDEYIPSGWDPQEECPKVFDYISKGEKPFLVTFGSMVVPGRVTYVSRQLLSGLRAAGIRRVLMLKGDANLGAHNLGCLDTELKGWAEEHVFLCDECPQYAWLMLKCRGVICHGGAGTTFASLRAGLPTIIAPVVVDQFFWGRLVENMGLGAVVEPSLREAKAEMYVRAIKITLRKEVVETTAAFAESVRRRGSGAKTAAELIGEALS